jgi:hypothetical protein
VGGDLAVQISGADVVSVFGTLYDGIDIDAVPAFSADRAIERISRLSASPRQSAELGGPAPARGGFALVYTLPVFTGGDRIVYSIDAHTGAVVEARSRSRASPQSGTATASSATTRR